VAPATFRPSVLASVISAPIAVPSQELLRHPQAAPDCAAHACLALTFDDGPNSQYTPMILDILERHHARATFFVVGSHVPGNEGLLRRMFSNGHEIGNHSWSHTDFTTLPPAQMEEQITHTQAAIVGAGVPAPTLFRPPYGATNPIVRSHVPLTLALWNIDPEDWKARDAQQIIARVNATARPGGIVELHDIHANTVDALEPILSGLEQQYQFVTVSDLLNLPPGQRGVYYGR
jgi:peptidoglycan/xylan/chitin deacetylase (PgdA/CDA1 family)